MEKHALVTGGCGFVGRHLTKRLLEQGYHVSFVDDCSTGLLPNEWLWEADRILCTYYHADIRNWMRTASPAKYDLIFHCAAVVGGRLKIDGDPLAVATDLSIDAEFFNWLARHRKQPPCKVVYFSSSAIYPVDLQTRNMHCALSEDLVKMGAARFGRPDQTYGWAKFTGEYLAKIAAEQYGIDVVCYRPFSGYGEDQDLSYPFPAVIKRVFDGENPLVVWGSGEQSRDFIYIEDALDGVFATMDKLSPGDVLNLGTGIGTTFRELAEMAARQLGREITVVADESKPEGVFRRVADTYKMSQWYTATTSLEAGVAKMLDKLRSEA